MIMRQARTQSNTYTAAESSRIENLYTACRKRAFYISKEVFKGDLDKEETEDPIAETFLRCYNKVGRTSDKEGFVRYFSIAIRNEYLRYMTKRSRHVRIEIQNGEDDKETILLTDTSLLTDPERGFSRDEAETLLKEAWPAISAQFSSKQREIIELMYLSGAEVQPTQEEVAKILGTSHQAVSKNLKKVMQDIHSPKVMECIFSAADKTGLSFEIGLAA